MKSETVAMLGHLSIATVFLLGEKRRRLFHGKVHSAKLKEKTNSFIIVEGLDNAAISHLIGLRAEQIQTLRNE